MSFPRVALIGECMIELQQHADGSLRQSFGGDTLNTAVYLARLLGERAKVDYVTALGDDSFSDAMEYDAQAPGTRTEMHAWGCVVQQSRTENPGQ